jgi:hypothetical protein
MKRFTSLIGADPNTCFWQSNGFRIVAVIEEGPAPFNLATARTHFESGSGDQSLGNELCKTRRLVCAFLLCGLLASCEKSKISSRSEPSGPSPEISPRQSSKTANFETGPASFDVCALLKIEEVQRVVAATITESSGSGRSDGSFRISQCVYVASQPNQSVSLVVTQADPVAKKKRKPADLWRERFGRYREQSEGKKEEAEEKKETQQSSSGEMEEEREGRPPRRIEGLGEEAFWTAGSLYVLHNETFLRLSVGGSDPEEAKLEHSKALAEIALKRF